MSAPTMSSFGAFTVKSIQAYLEARGWELCNHPDINIFLYRGPLADDGEPILQILPRSEQYADFPLRFDELVTALSIIEGRPREDIMHDFIATEKPTGAYDLATGGIRHARSSQSHHIERSEDRIRPPIFSPTEPYQLALGGCFESSEAYAFLQRPRVTPSAILMRAPTFSINGVAYEAKIEGSHVSLFTA